MPNSDFISADLIRARMPRRFQGTLHRPGEIDYRFLALAIERFWNDEENSGILRFRGRFQRIGRPPSGNGFLFDESDVAGSIHLSSRIFLMAEKRPAENGESWLNWEGRLPTNLQSLHALGNGPGGSEQLHLFARPGE